MKHYTVLISFMFAFFLLLFGVVEAIQLPLLTDPNPWLADGGVAAALVGVGLLVVDAVLPVPASLVMVAHGALFGLWLGALLSVVGNVGGALVAFAIGRRGGPWLARLVPAAERANADHLLAHWGDLALIVTRPIPIVAETMAILAGASTLGWGRMLLATIVGSLPAALLYAMTGAVAATTNNTVWMFGLVLWITGLFWLCGHYWRLRSRKLLEREKSYAKRI